MRFGFNASNNVAEYEALLASLRLSKEIQVRKLVVNNNSQFMVSQVDSNFTRRDKSMAAYLKNVMDLLPSFEKFELTQIRRIENVYADALSKLASSRDSKCSR